MADSGHSDELCLYLDVQQLLLHKRAHTRCMLIIFRCVAPFLLICHRYFLAHIRRHYHLKPQRINIFVVAELNYKQMVP